MEPEWYEEDLEEFRFKAEMSSQIKLDPYYENILEPNTCVFQTTWWSSPRLELVPEIVMNLLKKKKRNQIKRINKKRRKVKC